MKQKVIISNFTTLSAYDHGGRIRIVQNENGDEIGFEVRGTLTTFDLKNENGGSFMRDSYDKFVDDYFMAHSLNVPVCLFHVDTDPRSVCGIVKSMTKTENGVEIVAYISKRSCYYYNLIKGQIEDGILQGFSNYGGVVEADYDEKNDALNISQFALLHVALVATPSDTTATFKTTANTLFKGFGTEQNNVKETKDEKKKISEIDLIV